MLMACLFGNFLVSTAECEISSMSDRLEACIKKQRARGSTDQDSTVLFSSSSNAMQDLGRNKSSVGTEQ